MNEKKYTSSIRLSKTNKLIPRDISESLGKLPPQVLDLEEAILGAVILERSAQVIALEKVKPDDFYSEIHKEIFTAVKQLGDAGNPIDMRTVANQLRAEGKIELVGGAYYIAELTSKVSSAANIDYHIKIMVEKRILRDLIQLASSIHHDAYDDGTDPFELLKMLGDYMRDFFAGIKNSNEIDVGEEIRKLGLIISKRTENLPEITGVPSGYPSIDRITGGWQLSNLIIIGARPGMGKTTLVLNFIRNAAVDYKLPVAIFSMEMSGRELVYKLLSLETELEQNKLKNKVFSDDEWNQFLGTTTNIIKSCIKVDDTPALLIGDFKVKARKFVEEHKVKLIVVDYLQLMRGDPETKGNREREISSISAGLKATAKELDIPVIALSQLSRQVDTRGGDKMPVLSDLRESGSIEQDADLIMLLWRPAYYKITADAGGQYVFGLTKIIHAKHRNGPIGESHVAMDGPKSKFKSIDSPYYGGAADVKKITKGSETYDRKEVVEPESNDNDDLPF